MWSLLQTESSDLESLPGAGISEDRGYLPGKFHVRKGEASGAGRQSGRRGLPGGQGRGRARLDLFGCDEVPSVACRLATCCLVTECSGTY